jgi:hypothetical protein
VNAVSTRDFKRQLDNVDLSHYCSFLFNYCTPSFYAPLHNCLFKGVCEWLFPVHPGNDLPNKLFDLMDEFSVNCDVLVASALKRVQATQSIVLKSQCLSIWQH